MKTALLQLPVSFDQDENLSRAGEAVAWAAEKGADIAVLPEMFTCPYSNKYFADYAEEGFGPTRTALAGFAAKHGIYVVGGSMPEREAGRIYNTSFVYDRSGRQIARHRKMHLFDIDVRGGQRFFESETFTPGDDVTTFQTEFGVMGLCICFDIRFPELSRLMALRGAKVIFVPAAFNMTTGPAHWELAFRQRAVDSQLFTVGVSPARDEKGVYVAYGNSMAVSPWGTVLGRLDGGEGKMLLDLDLSQIEDIRAQLPLMSARRTDIYRLEELAR